MQVIRRCVGTLILLVGLLEGRGQNLNLFPSVGPDGQTGGAASHSPQFTPDSRSILFLSEANNLANNDDRGPFTDIFLHSIASKSNHLVSVARSGKGGGNGTSCNASASTDGSFVVFCSLATNLVDAFIPSVGSQVFWRDLRGGVTRLVSANLSGSGGNGPSYSPSISADGRRVVFVSDASDLVEEDGNQASDVFIWDADTEGLELVSRDETGQSTAYGASDSAFITRDGNGVIFRSSAIDLIPAPENGLATSEIYGWDFWTRTVYRVSEPSIQDPTNPALRRSPAVDPVLSPDGTYVGYSLVHGNGILHALVLAEREQPGLFWTQRWNKDVSNQLAEPLAISPVGPTLFCTLIDPVQNTFTLPQTQPVILRARPMSECSGPSDEAPPLAPIRMGCFRAESSGISLGAGTSAGVGWAGLSSELDVVLQQFSSSTALGISAPTIPLGKEWLDENDEEVRMDGLVLRPRERTAIRLPVQANPGSLALSPDGLWVAFDTSLSRNDGNDVNAAPDVHLVSLATFESRVVSQHVKSLPSQVTWPGPSLQVGAMNGEGDRIMFGGPWPQGPSLPQRTPSRELLLHDASSRELIPVTGVVLPKPGQPFLGVVEQATNVAVQACLDGPGNRAIVLARSRPPQGGLGALEPRLWYYDFEHARRQQLPGIPPDPAALLSDRPILSPPSFAMDRSGKFAVFATSSAYLVARDQDAFSDLFLFSVAAPDKLIRLTGPQSDEPGRLRGDSFLPAISPDGQFVAFFSRGTDVSPDLPGKGDLHLYLLDLATQTNHWIQSFPDGPDSFNLEIAWCQSSRFFAVHSPGFQAGVADAIAKTYQKVGQGLLDLHLSDTGRYMSATTWPEPESPAVQVIRFDLQEGTREWVSVSLKSAEPSSGRSISSQISPDGMQVFFASDAGDLVEGDDNHTTDIFVRDFTTGQTRLLSRSPMTGRSGNGPSSRPRLSDSGRVLIFTTQASDLVQDDFNGHEDLIAIHFQETDADRDGLPDAWEYRYFKGLETANSSSDFDGDGMPDGLEFALGTDPTDPQSLVGVKLQAPDEDYGWTVVWTLNPWRQFRIQWTDSLTDPEWRDISSSQLFALSGRFQDEGVSTTGSRFYRIVPDP